MSRDKYSNDHTISVGKGDGTLTIDANLSVDGNFNVEAVELATPVTQTYRMLGNAFSPRDSSDAANVSIDIQGRLNFTSVQTTVHAPVLGLPHGAIITGLRIRGVAVGASDTLTVTLWRSTGGVKNSLASITLNNEGSLITGDNDETAVVDNFVVDYSGNTGLFVGALGNEGSASVYLDLVDVNYIIEVFPQDSTVSLD